MHKQFATNNLYRDITLASSEFVYINNDLAIDYIKHFINVVKRKRVDIYILLIINSCNSHKTFEFEDLYIKNNIISFLFLLHSTYILQSFNIEVFQIYKQHYENKIYKIVLRDNIKFDKLAFLKIFQIFRDIAFKLSTIKHVFKQIDILLFNFVVVLDFAKKKHAFEVVVARSTCKKYLI